MEDLMNIIAITLMVIIVAFYLAFEIGILYYARCFIIQLIIVGTGLKKRISKDIPPWWTVKKIEQLSSINRPFLKYRVWVEFESLSDDKQYIHGWILLNRFGRIENKSDLNLSFSDKDIYIPEETIKKYKRNKILDELL